MDSCEYAFRVLFASISMDSVELTPAGMSPVTLRESAIDFYYFGNRSFWVKPNLQYLHYWGYD